MQQPDIGRLTLSDLGVPSRGRLHLNRAGIDTPAKLQALTPADLLKIDGIGTGTYDQIRDALVERGFWPATAHRCGGAGTPSSPEPAVDPTSFVVPPGFILIHERTLAELLGEEKMAVLRAMMRFPVRAGGAA